MTNDDKLDISRRSVLGGLGAIGIGAAAAGLGTTAYLNDTESFTDNTLTAGELDLKVDWEEHYYDGSAGSGMVNWTDPGEGAVGFPDPTNPHVWVAEEDVSAFMDETSIEAFPDPDNDGIQEMETEDYTYVPCEQGADLDEDLDPDGETGLRSLNADTVANWPLEEGEDAEPASLVALDDVKPGDFGEFTLSFHLCDNPGYVWLHTNNISESENSIIEPEADVDETPDDAELAENIETVWWYDHSTAGNNVIDTEIGVADVMVVLDRSGSLSQAEYDELRSSANDLVQGLIDAGGDVNVGGLTFGNDVTLQQSLGSSSFDFPNLSPNGGTAMPAALDIADQLLDAGRPGAEQYIILVTDGAPHHNNTTYSTNGVTAPRTADWSWDVADQAYDNAGSGGTAAEFNETELVADLIKDGSTNLNGGRTVGNAGDLSNIVTVYAGTTTTTETFLQNRVATDPQSAFSANTPGAVSAIVSDIIEAVAMTEEVFYRGSLLDALNEFDDGTLLDGDLTVEGEQCFEPGVNHYIGFAWWLSEDVGNEVQSDSVSFDFGFYTEQCRHNDGSGGPPA